MPSERIQRQIDQILDEIESARGSGDWSSIRNKAQEILDLDPENADAAGFLAAARRRQQREKGTSPTAAAASHSPAPPAAQPTSFANGRYAVTKFLGEGGKKKVYLARDSLLDRDVAFALIKTEGLDEASRVRVQREAQAMGRLGAHPHIVTVFDIGEEDGQPYLVLPVLAGGDVEGVIEKAPENKLTIEHAVKIAVDTCLGLEFAHSKGIVHRDLKPGNVWLTEDGRAMIGDFGLAVAVDKSRLTQAGMMVGTVNYMPPEQAMGGEVGPRSDLYSLGAMLYEMVCGRPPFVGDESVAIIGQHLNTPPVAPSWHRPDCPPALEVLILRLLEKDPSKRPSSAEEVRQALESVSTVPRPRDPSVAAEMLSNGDNPLYRRTFVGRENEVRQLQQAFDAALSGQGGLVMVVGEPGIGKTALCEQLATYVALRGGKALVGHCYEEGSLSLPYLAFVEAMRSYVLAREPDGLRSDLGTGAADVARIVSEVRDRMQGVELRPAGDPEDDRWRLLQAVTSFLRNASTVQPLCIVLEDLHWADRGTLDLLLHVSRNLQGARMLIVGTYRDVEVDRAHPLSNALADLRRASDFLRVPLRGLTVDEVHRMYEAVQGQATPWAQAEAVFRATEGNPLFVQEVLRYLVEEGIVVREDGRYVAPGGVGTGIPEGLRDVVGKRLSRLSPECNRVLSVAAVIGRDFDLATLRAIAGLDEDALLSAIEEAVRVGVLEERSMPGAVRYRFAHAFFRQSLYEEMIAPRRLRLHQEVARALEAQYASRREEHAAELAEHYGQSTDRSDLAKAVEYSEVAAKRAMSVFAYAEAEGHLGRCLEVQEVLDPEDRLRRCDLLVSLGDAILPQEARGDAVELVTQQAFLLADEMGARRLALRAALQALSAVWTAGARQMPTLGRSWVARAEKYVGLEEPEFSMRLAYYRAVLAGQSAGGPAAMHREYRKVIKEATLLQDDKTFFGTAGLISWSLRALQDAPLRDQLAEEVLRRSHDSVSSRDLGVSLAATGRTLIERGDRAKAQAVWDELVTLAERTRDLGVVAQALSVPLFPTFFDGHVEEALALAEARVERSLGVTGGTAPGTGGLHDIFIARLSSYLGRPVVLSAARLELHGNPRSRQATLAYVMALQGDIDAARSAIQTFGTVASDEDETNKAFLASLLEAAVIIKDSSTIDALKPRFSPFADRLAEVSNGIGVETSVGRLLGKASLLESKPDEARGFFDRGLQVSQKVRFRPEVALIRLELAELLLEDYPDEHDAAIEHLDFAIAELRDMKMQPALERALRHRGLLKA